MPTFVLFTLVLIDGNSSTLREFLTTLFGFPYFILAYEYEWKKWLTEVARMQILLLSMFKIKPDSGVFICTKDLKVYRYFYKLGASFKLTPLAMTDGRAEE